MNRDNTLDYSIDELYECPLEITEDTIPCKITKPGDYKIKGKINSTGIGIIVHNTSDVIIEGSSNMIKSEINAESPIVVFSSRNVTIKNINLSGNICISGLDIDNLNIYNVSIKNYKEVGIMLDEVDQVNIKNLVINSKFGVNGIVINKSESVKIDTLKTNVPIEVKISDTKTVDIFNTKTIDLICKNVETISLSDAITRQENIEKFKIFSRQENNKTSIISV